MTPKERAAMQQALLYLKAWQNGEEIKSYEIEDTIAAIEKALAEQAEQEPVAWLVQYKDCHTFVWGRKPEFIVDGVVEPLYAAPVEPVKQEPVAWMDLHKELGKLRWMGGDEGWDNAINAVRDRLIELATPHLVRTKDPCNPLQDLTDDEILEISLANKLLLELCYGQMFEMQEVTTDLAGLTKFARAVIAADRELNK